MAVPKPTDKIYGTEEAVAKGLMDLLGEKKPKILSDLDDEEILNLSLLYSLGDKTKIDSVIAFCDNFLKLRVSRFRLGRREIVFVAGAGNEPDRKRFRTIKDLFSGLR
jgi:hypothetical protein